MIFIGDIMPVWGGRKVRFHAEIQALLARADLVIGNCEAPITGKTRARGNHFQLGKAYLRAVLQESGIRPDRCILSVANNHAGDQGEAGLTNTVAQLLNIGIRPLGQVGPQRSPIERIGCRRLTLGVVTWTHWLNRECLPAMAGIWRVGQIENLTWPAIKSTAGVDCLIGLPHWGYEFQHYPDVQTQHFAHHLLAQGFDLLAGHHPHVVQPIERFDHQLCLYSLGNFNGYPGLPFVRWPIRIGFIFEIRLVSVGLHRGTIAGYTIHPVAVEVKSRQIWLVPLAYAAPSLRQRASKRLQQLFDLTQSPDT